MGCGHGDLDWEEERDFIGLLISLVEKAEPNFIKLRHKNPCIGYTDIRTFNLGTERKIECSGSSGDYWTVEYERYESADTIGLKVCFYEGGGTPTPCSDHQNSSDCLSFGCYWYNGSCHSNPEDQPEEDLTDYQRIKNDVNDAVAPVLTQLTGIERLIADVKSYTTSVYDSLSNEIEGVLGDLTGVINRLDDKLSEEISEVTGAVTNGLESVSDQIAELNFPTLDSIKQAFLDVCFDLAMALWDTILEKIEERYPDDEEEV